MTTTGNNGPVWRLPAVAVLGGLLSLLVQAAIAGVGGLWWATESGPGSHVTFGSVLLLVTVALAALALLLLLVAMVRRRLGPMRLAALLGVVPPVITVLQPNDVFPVLIGLVGAAVLGLVLVFVAPRPKVVVYR